MKTLICSTLIFLFCTCCQHRQATEELVLIQVQDRNGVFETINSEEKLTTWAQKNYLSSQPYQKVLRLYRKEHENRSIITTYHPNGIPWQLLEAKELRAFGAFQEWHPNGALKIDAIVIGGTADLTPSAQETWLFDKQAQVRDESGRLIATINYSGGLLEGPSLRFYPTGSIRSITPYVQGKADGIAKEYWEDGQILSNTTYQKGLQHGSSCSFWANGNSCSEEEFEQGLLKKGHYWDSSGQLISEVAQGSGYRAIFKENKLHQLQEIKKGDVDGNIKIFDAQGNLHSIHKIKKGQKHGEEIEYYPPNETDCSKKPQPKISLQWDRNTLHGTVKTWYDNGQVRSQRDLSKNKRNGPSCAWYRDGTLMLLEEYEGDLLMKGTYYRKNKSEPVSTIVAGNGLATLFDEEGALLRKISYAKGKPVDPE